MEAWGRGGTGTGGGAAAGTVTDADVGPEGRCSGWPRRFAVADVEGVFGRAIGGAADGGCGCGGSGGGGGRRVVLSMEDQPPVRNAGAG